MLWLDAMRLDLAGDFIDKFLPGSVRLWDCHVLNFALSTDGIEDDCSHDVEWRNIC
jgi:hypothetical protein